MLERMDLYQTISNEVFEQLPSAWDNAFVILEIDSDLSVFEMWYEASGVEELLELSNGISEAFKKLWKSYESDEKGQWKICKYVLMPDGNFTIDFDYDAKLSWED